MQASKVLGIAISLIMSFSALKADTLSIEDLDWAFTTFLCEDENKVANLPLVFFESKSGWEVMGVGDDQTSVTVNKNGFMIKFLPPNEGIGLLSDAQYPLWKYEYLGDLGSFETVCSSQDQLTNILIKAITPKIVEYANSISLLEYKELITANDKIKSLEIDLTKSYLEFESKNVASENAAIRHKEEMAIAAEHHKKELATANERHKKELSESIIESYKNNQIANIVINKLKRCWIPPVGVENGLTNVITLGLRFDIDGKLVESPVNLTPNSGVGSLQAFEAARRAVIRCSPYNELDPNMYQAWKEIKIKFDSKNLGR
jgi:hypothetical protein